jgi:hypothetical protein
MSSELRLAPENREWLTEALRQHLAVEYHLEPTHETRGSDEIDLRTGGNEMEPLLLVHINRPNATGHMALTLTTCGELIRALEQLRPR